MEEFEKADGERNRNREPGFDTDYFKGVVDADRRQYYYVECMDNIYADNEINYLGIGMYEAWLGNSKFAAEALTLGWKTKQYPGQPIPPGTWYWLNRGHNDFNKINDMPRPLPQVPPAAASEDRRRSK